MAHIISGITISKQLSAAISAKTQDLKQQHNVTPGLAVILVGDDPASQSYVKAKGKKAAQLGFLSIQETLPSTTTEAELLSLIARYNNDPLVHGILVQLPLPPHIDSNKVIHAITPEKDVDGFTYVNVGKYITGDTTGFLPCTPAGVMLMIQSRLGDDLAGLRAVVVGRSNIVGKPMASLLLSHNATVTTVHRYSPNLPAICREADILVVAIGKPRFIQADWVKPDSVVIDVGINRITEDGVSKLVGDVDYDQVLPHVKAITPVPGGVGPMTIAMLLANTLTSALQANGLPRPAWNDYLVQERI